MGLLSWNWACIHRSAAESDEWSGCPLLSSNDGVGTEFPDLVRADGRLTFSLGNLLKNKEFLLANTWEF